MPADRTPIDTAATAATSAVAAIGPPLDERDAHHLRRAIALSAETAARGNGPFGAVIVAADGTVLVEAVNDTAATGDCTGHAETRALQAATPAHARERLAGATLYASGEPCAMCAGAIVWSGIRRVVFGVDIASMRRIRGADDGAPDLAMPCREVFATSAEPVEVVGPALLDEAIEPLRAATVPAGGDTA